MCSNLEVDHGVLEPFSEAGDCSIELAAGFILWVYCDFHVKVRTGILD